MPTTLRNFRCDDERWGDFLTACESEGTDASKQIRDMIDVWLEGRDAMAATIRAHRADADLIARQEMQRRLSE